MTKQECAVVQAYTGICMLTGDDLSIYYSYINHLFGRPVFTHEIPELHDEIRKRSHQDFINLCDNAVDMNSVLSDMNDYLCDTEDMPFFDGYDETLEEVLEEVW